MEGTPIDQIVIGSCTNGRLDDIETAAGILKGKRVHKSTRMLVFPASGRIFQEAIDRGYVSTLMKAGAVVIDDDGEIVADFFGTSSKLVTLGFAAVVSYNMTTGEAVKGEVLLGNGLTEHVWVSLEEAKNYELIEGIYEEMEMLAKIMNNQEAGGIFNEKDLTSFHQA